MFHANTRLLQMVVVAVASVVGGAATPTTAGDADADFPALLNKKSSTLVTVKFVLRIGGTADREMEEEITGVQTS